MRRSAKRLWVMLLVGLFFEAALVCKGVAQQCLVFFEVPGLTVSYDVEKVGRILAYIEKMTMFTQFLPDNVEESQQAIGRKLARKWLLRTNFYKK